MSDKPISEGQYRYLKGKINALSCQLSEVLYKLNQIKASRVKHLIAFEESIPPKSVCIDVLSMLGVGNYKGMMRLLSDYYGISRLQLFHDPKKVPDGAIACYVRQEGIAYSKNPTINEKTVLHEFFHHLVTLNVVVIDEEDEEVLANKYAKIFLERAKL